MEAISVRLDDSLIAVRCAIAKPQVPESPLVEAHADGLQPRMCYNESSLTASGGDFGFTEIYCRDAVK